MIVRSVDIDEPISQCRHEREASRGAVDELSVGAGGAEGAIDASNMTNFHISLNPQPNAAPTATLPQKEQSKVGAPESTNLIIEEPESDKAAAETNLIARIEGLEISLKPGKSAPSDFDYIQIANALQGLAKAFPESPGIDPECEIISLISKRIPELALLSKNSKGKKIPLASLETILEPYVRGDKPLK